LVRGGDNFSSIWIEGLYNQMMGYFDKTFFKFLAVFILIILVSIGIIAYVRGYF